jgi:NarL family two-component system response regulator LiaR
MEREEREQGRIGGEPIRVVLVDADPMARRVMRDALRDAGVVVVAEARDGDTAVDLAARFRPDVVLMDVLPNMEGIPAMRRILVRLPDVPVIMISTYDEEELGMLCLRAGAIGYLSKSVDPRALPRATRAAATGQAVISRGLTLRLIEMIRQSIAGSAAMRPVRSTLTTREWEVLDLLGRHLSTSEIASALFVSADTVRSHVKHILRKLEVHTRQEAIDLSQTLRSPADGEPKPRPDDDGDGDGEDTT